MINLIPTIEIVKMLESLHEIKKTIEDANKQFHNESLTMASNHLTEVITILVKEKSKQ